jgi:LacI family transcriptional regulator
MMSHAIETTDPRMIADALGPIPLVQFDRVFRSLPGAKVVNDNFESAYAATRHLIANGYRKIGTLAGYSSCEAFIDRFRGYRKALEDGGLTFDESIVFPESIVRQTGYDACMKAIDAGCDALYSAGDFSALGAMEALRDRGLSVPKDFGVVGTADETFASLMSPSLSSLSQHAYDMGRAAAKAFLFQSQATTVISMELHIRESSNRNSICQK